MKHLHKTREMCSKRLNNIPGVTFPKVEGTYVPFPKFDLGLSSKDLGEYLIKEAKVGLSGGHGFGSLGEGHMRICIATSEAIMNEALDRLEPALRKLG